VSLAHVVDETELDEAAALAGGIVSAVGVEHTDKLGECHSAFSLSYFLLYPVYVYARHAVGGLRVESASAAGEEARIRIYCLESGIQYSMSAGPASE
jgi:hypothetical protein